MSSQPCFGTVELLKCSLCGDNKLYKGNRGLAIHTARRHGIRVAVDPSMPSASQPAPSTDRDDNFNSSTSFAEKLGSLKRNVPIIKRIPRGARRAVASSLTECVAKVVKENSVQAWERLLTFSYSVLHANKSKKDSLTKQIKDNTFSISVSPVNLPNNVINSNVKSYTFSKINSIESKISEGNVSGAARLLFSNDVLATHSAETFAALRKKHPVRRYFKS